VSEHSSEDVPGLVICTRFGLGITAPEWFAHRLLLLEAITAASLRAQTDQNFHWIIFIDQDLDRKIVERLRLITEGCGTTIITGSRPYSAQSIAQIARELGSSKQEYILTGRIDDDDALHRTTVQRIRETAASWIGRAGGTDKVGLGMTFPDGLEWLMYDMVDVDKMLAGHRIVRRQSIRDYNYTFLGTSVFVLSKSPGEIVSVSTSHSKMHQLLTDNGYDVRIFDNEPAMWLYVRHKQAASAIQKARGGEASWSLDELAARFGISARLTAKYIEDAGSHRYALEKRSDSRRSTVIKELSDVEKALLETPRDESLLLQRTRCLDELQRMSSGILGDVPD
jgi:AraC-like DNA-binding protein